MKIYRFDLYLSTHTHAHTIERWINTIIYDFIDCDWLLLNIHSKHIYYLAQQAAVRWKIDVGAKEILKCLLLFEHMHKA
jgi:hypothetical protein